MNDEVTKVRDAEKELGDIIKVGGRYKAYYDYANSHRVFNHLGAARNWIETMARQDKRYTEQNYEFIHNDNELLGMIQGRGDGTYWSVRLKDQDYEDPPTAVRQTRVEAIEWIMKKEDSLQDLIEWLDKKGVHFCIKTAMGYQPLHKVTLSIMLQAYREEHNV